LVCQGRDSRRSLGGGVAVELGGGGLGEGRAEAVEELGLERGESCGVVDVVPARELDELEAGGAGAGAGLLEDGGGAPVDAGEGLGVGVLEADEVIAAVVGGAEDEAVAGAGELVDGLLEGEAGDGGRVGVDEADGGEAEGEDVLGGVEEALAEAVAALGDEGEGGWQEAVEGGLVTDGGVGDESGGAAFLGYGGEVFGGVAQEGDVEGG
jgi:hypothetical protein